MRMPQPRLRPSRARGSCGYVQPRSDGVAESRACVLDRESVRQARTLSFGLAVLQCDSRASAPCVLLVHAAGDDARALLVIGTASASGLLAERCAVFVMRRNECAALLIWVTGSRPKKQLAFRRSFNEVCSVGNCYVLGSAALLV